ncbi:MAG: CusA/CzcA family heavy metal efflux RND transporter [Bacteroidota bacterium]
MLSKIIEFSLKSKFIILLFTLAVVGYGSYSLTQVSIGAVPDITNNQVQVITTSRNLSTADVEQFITLPLELEMANLPGVEEIRSISKFGLSVITVVFEDDMGTYLPRQLIAEKLESASDDIPPEFGQPKMGPITTGLGEIYQYTLEVEPAYKDQYDATELRSIQDWIVKRQLSGMEGVVEINTWGGFLKEYEIAFDTKKLQAQNISIQRLFAALRNNNTIAGGSYIEKENQSYFIRGDGLVKNIDEIEQILVENRNGQPILVKDLAEVRFGHARRFGAITGNGEGEKVLGQIMMLKDADANSVITNVKDRLTEIENSLPEGVYINGFLDRSELISRTTSTIAENLILGFLVVAFVVILLIGDLRSGLIIASVIPLSFLIAISLMHIFDVDANLMSLGALDFGIIIDGAVIIVEFVAFKMMKNHHSFQHKKRAEIQELKDKITFNGATKMMKSAIFGQIIILLVFIPIFSLQGVEGKMFAPMALTFCFALIGAIILCFTWIPVAASWFLKPSKISKNNFSSRLINAINSWYQPLISWSLKNSKTVLVAAILTVLIGGFTFTKMGAEFVPTLDEGDFVIQPILKTGKSLKSTVERTTKIEQVLLDKFPEVQQVVSRIGAAEVPTDPMSMQDSDVIIRLAPRGEWVSADSKEELADKIKNELSIFPNMEIEFTQPIEMRFNELLTGVRSDLAIKIYGEDLNILSSKGNEIKNLIENVEGAADITVEKIIGLPQISVDFNRSKIARYGLDIKSVNEVITAGFAGLKTGVVFEGEKRFDLVARLQEDKRQDISDVENLIIDTPNHGKIPLSEVAEISYSKGPAKISRDQAQRRIVVGVNVRNRDLKTVVEEAKVVINNNLDLPSGYHIEYGGQFENLESASKRLQIALPIALALIFVLLYFALSSVKDAALIFTAIPFSAVGGVALLWLRDMPFSISAGVGFIALFGVSVLNGIILVENFKNFQRNNQELSIKNIIKACQQRLRAVLLTASSTALGFLPMAISTGAGAEVQRPLATVVIGGLVTSTILTLIVLPVFYFLVESYKNNKMKINSLPKNTTLILVLILGSVFSSLNAQESEIEVLKDKLIENNKLVHAQKLTLNQFEAAENRAFEFDKTQIYQNYDEAEWDPIANEPLYQWGIGQSFDFPSVYGKRKKSRKAQTKLQSIEYDLSIQQQFKRLELAYQDVIAAKEKVKMLRYLDSVYIDFSRQATDKFEEGESTYLEKITAQSKQEQIKNEKRTAKNQLLNAQIELQNIIQSEDSIVVEADKLQRVAIQFESASPQLIKRRQETQIQWRESQLSLAKNELLPGIYAEYFVRSHSGIDKNFSGYQIGLQVPLLFFGNRSKIKEQKLAVEVAKTYQDQQLIEIENQQTKLINQIENQEQRLESLEKSQLAVADEILKTAKTSYEIGEISFFEYVQSIDNAMQIKLNYVEQLQKYNQFIIQFNYLFIR